MADPWGQKYAHERECHLCHLTGGSHHAVAASKAFYEQACQLADRLEPICRTRGRMLGLMRVGDEVVACLSGGAAVSYQFVLAVLSFRRDTVIPMTESGLDAIETWAQGASVSPIAHDWSTVPERSLGGRPLSALFKDKAKKAYFDSAPGQVGGPGCWCAAPKLVSYFTQCPHPYREGQAVELIEMWCGKTLDNVEPRTHKQVAGSCGKCKNILPTLMCRKLD